MSKKIVVIGSGFSGLAAAACLAQAGFDVTVLEKNAVAGGRARKFEAAGFTFDMGPSWYWMPEVFEDFFGRFGKKASDYYDLMRLDPSYIVHFNEGEAMQVPAGVDALAAMFERYEAGAGQKLRTFLAEAAYKYETGMTDFVFRPGHSIMEFADWRVLTSLFKLHIFTSVSKQVHTLFKHPHLRELLEFPSLFLGARPADTPALYTLMNYADMSLGTWYPMGGMYEIVGAMVATAVEQGANIRLNETVESITVEDGKAVAVVTQNGTYAADFVVAGADYHHVEQQILEPQYRQYTEKYWQSRTMAPSSLLFYLGVGKRLSGLAHHNLFFDADFDQHAADIYTKPAWPQKPLFYVCCPSKTDPSVAPVDSENLFVLIPLAPGLEDSEALREAYYHLVLERLERRTGQQIRDSVVYKRSFAMTDFEQDYNAFRGNAYGLANTLRQTAFLKPKMRSNKISNLFYTGQLTVPGPGVPPSLISGQVVAAEIKKLV